MKIYYFDFVASGGVHTTFNSAMIEVLNKVYPENKGIVLHSEKKHGKIVQKKCFTKIQIKPLYFLFSKIIKYSKIRDLLAILFLLPTMFKASSDDIIYLGLAFPFCICFVNFFSKALKKYIFITLHGELQYFLPCDQKYIQIKHKKYFCSTKKHFARGNRYIAYVILGEPIFSAIAPIFENNKNIIVINHPAIFLTEKTEYHSCHLPLTVGMIGGGLERKGVNSIFKIAEFLKEEIINKKVIIKICGFYSCKIKNHNQNLVKYFNRTLSEKELQKEIETLDYSFQLSTDSICKAVASGTFIDSLIYGKPVIGLHSSYLDFYIPDNYPIFDTEKEVAQKIKEYIYCQDSEFYKKDLEMTLQLREKFSVDFNALLFKEQTENIWKH